MAGRELAKAYVQLVPSFKGAKNTIASELGAQADQATKTLGAKFKTFGASLAKTTFGGLAKATKIAGVTAGASFTAGFGVSMAKGFSRLKAIEQAQVGLKGMKLSTEQIADVMQSANTAVKGTAFGLGDAARQAQGMVAAGVKPGKDLTRILSLIGDTAAQTGSDFNDMGLIWGQIAARGKLYGGDALQLMQRGIPIWQAVGKEMGVTAEEAQDLASKGKVSFDVFAKAMENSFGGSAQAMGKTFQGSLQNLGAAMGRFGEATLKSSFAYMPTIFTDLTGAVDKATKKVKPFGEQLGLTVRGLWEVGRGAKDSTALVAAFGVTTGTALTKSLLSVRDVFSDMGKNITRVGDTWRKTFSGINLGSGIATGIEKAGKALGGLQQAFFSIVEAIAPFAKLTGAITAMLGNALLDAIAVLAPAFGTLGTAILNASQPLMYGFTAGIQALVTILTPIVNGIAGLASAFASLPSPILLAAGAFLLMKTRVGGLVTSMGGGLTSAVTSVRGAFDTWQLRAHIGQMSGMSRGAAIMGSAMGGVKNVAGSLGKGLLNAFGGPVGLAVTGLTAAVGYFAQSNAKAKEHAQELANSLDKVTGAATKATTELIADKISTEQVKAFEEMGGNIQILTGAIEGNAQALEKYKAILAQYRKEHKAGRIVGERGQYRQSDEHRRADAIENLVNRETSALKKAQAEHKKTADATRDHAQSVDDLTRKQDENYNKEMARGNKRLQQIQAEKQAQDAIKSTTEALKGMEKGSLNARAEVAKMGESLRNSLKADWDSGVFGKSQMQERVKNAREMFEQIARSAGVAEGEIKSLVQDLMLNDGAIISMQVRADAENAWRTVDDFRVEVDTRTGTIKINGDMRPAEQKLNEFLEMDEWGYVNIGGETLAGDMTVAEYVARVNNSKGEITIGGNTVLAHEVLTLALQAVQNGQESFTINGNTFNALVALEELRKKAAEPTSKPVYVKATGLDAVRAQIEGLFRGVSPKVPVSIARNPALTNADGGFYRSFANGTERHVAQIGNGITRVWNEPETGGEAYIPLSPAKRRRSEHILGLVAREFGYSLVDANAKMFANGGATVPNIPAYRPEAGVISPGTPRAVTVNVVDSDGVLIGRMRGEALQAIDDMDRWR